MECPSCHREMEEGVLELQASSRIGVYWSFVDDSRGVDAQGLPYTVTERLGNTSLFGGRTKMKGGMCRGCDLIAFRLSP